MLFSHKTSKILVLQKSSGAGRDGAGGGTCLVLFPCSFCLVIFLLMVLSPDHFPEKKFSDIFLLRDRLFCMVLFEQLGDSSSYVVCAACSTGVCQISFVECFYLFIIKNK